MSKRGLMVMGLATALAAVVFYSAGEAQDKKAAKRAASISTLMKCCVQPNCAGAGKLVNGTLDDKGFATVALQAQMLNELGYALMADGRCLSGDWANACKTLQEGSAKLAAAAAAKNGDDAKAAFKGLTGSCATCHKAHKK